MKSVDSNQPAYIWFAVLFIIFCFTIGIFLAFAPGAPHYSYWVAMADIALMELFIGTYIIYYLFLAERDDTGKPPVAMHIGIVSTMIVLFVISLIMLILLLLVF
jgi:hypothetical protein